MAKTSETVRPMTDGQRSDIIAMMVSAMPSLSFDQAQGIIGNKGPFVANIGEVFRRHAGQPAAASPSAEFTIGNRTYELIRFLKKDDEGYVPEDVMVERARALSANLGEEDCAFILEHQAEIPQEFQGKFYLVFTDWRLPSSPSDVAYLEWSDDRWLPDWHSLSDDWDEGSRLVRRRA